MPTIANGGAGAETVKSKRPMIFSADGNAVEGPVYDGASFAAGATVEGPAVIEEDTTTIVIEPGWRATLHESGSYVLKRIDQDPVFIVKNIDRHEASKGRAAVASYETIGLTSVTLADLPRAVREADMIEGTELAKILAQISNLDHTGSFRFSYYSST